MTRDCPTWSWCGIAKWSWPCCELVLFPPPVLASVLLFIVSRFPPLLQAVKVILYGRYAHLLYEGTHLDYSFGEDLLLLELPLTCAPHHLSLGSSHFSPALLQAHPSLPLCFLVHQPPSIFLILRWMKMERGRDSSHGVMQPRSMKACNWYRQPSEQLLKPERRILPRKCCLLASASLSTGLQDSSFWL